MKQYKMSDNDAWNAFDDNFGADVIITTDDMNNYQKAEVKLDPDYREVPAQIQLEIKDGRFVANLTLDQQLNAQSTIADVAEYARSLQHYSDFMEVLEDEANGQLKAEDGLFDEHDIKC